MQEKSSTRMTDYILGSLELEGFELVLVPVDASEEAGTNASVGVEA